MAIGYTKTIWANYVAPAINALNLNKIEQGIYEAHETVKDILDGTQSVGLADKALTLDDNYVYPESLSPIGSITMFGGTTIPFGWLECDGAEVNRVGTYINLYATIGTSFGVGNGDTTFNIPDLRGQFVRGLSYDNDVDPENRTIGSVQAASVQSHFHWTVGVWSGYSSAPLIGNQTIPSHSVVNNYLGGYVASGDPEAEAVIGKSSTTKYEDSVEGTADDTRPSNVALIYIIRAN